ncbi:MaoC family dehydratase [Actinorugispora endophytica]|uniref:Acyl dehydratase n=1 Tax=Actinorugispora endophytica TaxID=1605990 RepID=A0A4R6UYJ5_9ACTN|nr:MaoC family dehydratase [Actinorugispora endophytica]TDQ52433.1 acyl dehydratase [Actinorugispora endophytica]
MQEFADVFALAAARGRHLGHSPWHTVTQEQVNLFADATGDHQWIHVDAERAASGPFGGTIAHGFLSLSLLPLLGGQVYTLREPPAMGINYGLNRVRFLQPVPVGARVRDGVEVAEAKETPKGLLLTMRHTVEIEGQERAALVAEALVLLVP